jgi:hypothetical protein
MEYSGVHCTNHLRELAKALVEATIINSAQGNFIIHDIYLDL